MRTKRAIVLIAATAALLLGASVAIAAALDIGPFGTGSQADPGPVIARVEGRPIHLEEARARVEGLTSVHGSPEADWEEIVLQSLVDDALLEAKASEMGLSVTDAELESHVAEIRTMFDTEEAFVGWLDSQGMTESELVRRITLQTLAVKVYEEVTRDVQVSTEDIRAYYREHRTEYVGPDGEIMPLLAVRQDIRDDLLKQAKDEAYGAWLQEQRAQADVVVLMDDWWRTVS